MGAWAACLLLLAAICAQAQGQLVIKAAKREIDISGHVVRTKLQLTVRNDGGSPAASVLLCDAQADRLAFLEAEQKVASAKRLQWAAAAAPAGAPEGTACREFTLEAPLKKGQTAELTAYGAHTRVLRPDPAQVKQSEPQHVLFRGTAQLSSPYKVEQQSTEIKTGGGVQSFSSVDPSSRSGGRITYGPYKGAAPWSAEPISVHYENNTPFLVGTAVERELEVSHWGSVHVEERYSLRHEGAKVAGEWSRFDLSKDPKRFARTAVPALAAVAPPAARALFFRDSIGDISSSDFKHELKRVTAMLQPRYPLFGGWAATFKFGWSQPLASAVAKDPATGRMRFVSTLGPSIADLAVDELVVKVVLPEGARDPQVTCDVPMAAEPQHETKITYLDLMGRPVVTLRFANVVGEMNRGFEVSYVHSSMGLLQKPLLLMAVFACIFAAAILLGRGSLLGGSSPNLAKQHAA